MIATADQYGETHCAEAGTRKTVAPMCPLMGQPCQARCMWFIAIDGGSYMCAVARIARRLESLGDAQ